MFYPRLSRRSQYSSPGGRGGLYADYKQYAAEIANDCQRRCVYCDAKISENMGGDAFQLDHFRPQYYFPHLKCDPKNLVLACPACNRFKWNHWPAGTDTSETHVSGKGFIEPFNSDRLDYFEVNTSGHILSKQDPAAYIVKLLHLDRSARNNMRRRRIIMEDIASLLKVIPSELESAADAFENEQLTKIEYLEKARRLHALLDRLKSIFSKIID